jgi:hypothetical protein
MTIEEWEDVHDYSPPSAKGAVPGEGEAAAAAEEEGEEVEDSSIG